MHQSDGRERAGAPVYRSGVAARLVGVPVDTLRVWERRYSVVAPRVSPGRQRLYGDEDIRRLALIKQLVDMGHSIGAIASLDFPALDAMRLSTQQLAFPRARREGVQANSNPRIALVGSLLLTSNVARKLSDRGFEVVATCSEAAQASTTLRGLTVDLIVLELATLREADVPSIDAVNAACTATSSLVLYRFASSAVVRRLRSMGYFVSRTTTDAADIESWCRALLAKTATTAAPPVELAHAPEPPRARFDERALAAMALASQAIACECPAHLADLVLSLGSFERYSAQCANDSPAEAALHQELRRAAGHARSIIEQALERVAIFEGIELPVSAQATK